MSYFSPGGNRLDSRSMVSWISWAVDSAFEPGRWKMPSAIAG